MDVSESFEVEDSYNSEEKQPLVHSFSVDELNMREDGVQDSPNNLKGVLIMIVACCCFGAMGFMIKIAYTNNPDLTGFDVMLVRSCTMWPVYYIIAKILKVNLISIKRNHFFVLIFRCLTGATGMSLLFASIKLLPTSIAFMIFNLNPLFVTVIAFTVLGEKFEISKALYITGAFIGVLIVGYGRRNETTLDVSQIYAVILCIGAAFLCGLAVASMRKLNKHIHYIFSPYYLCIFCLGACVCAYLYDFSNINIQNYGKFDWIYLCAAGTLSLLGQLLLSLAFKYAHASSAAPLLYINCLFNVFTDIFYFKLSFFISDIAGACLITLCIFTPIIILCFKKE
ncbi:unnamed protein product [Moneuplotes crassus]|uniref:EamA domain-containing protein n=1 Tax=Euplotes crassus TaxID=5936 RepID=A0AAD1XLY8_EUPCR|nr:unnamed protein product [Moneuplotes crassus]